MINGEGRVELHGIVESVTYKNRENGYTVLKLKTTDDVITVTGEMPFVNEGDAVNVFGNYIVHPTYGKQFKCDLCEVSTPETEAQVLKFLSSGAIKGIGPATALKIVDYFKEDTLDVIENAPLKLTVIKGISTDKAIKISEQYKSQFGIRDVMMALARFKISPLEAAEIYKSLGTNSVQIIKSNPYALCNDTIGFSFERAELIAEEFNIPVDNENRIMAGVIYVLKANLLNGHTCLPQDKLANTSSKLLSVSENAVIRAIEYMVEIMKLYSYTLNDKAYVFLPEFAAAEQFISGKISAFLRNNTPLTPISDAELRFVENRLGIEFDPEQIDAVNSAMQNNFFILTGGPGTGKTTTLNALIEIFENRDLSIVLAAPTGRAAKRMTELTRRDAKTLHRLLEVEWLDGATQSFAKNKTNPLDYDVLIIDEMSMVDALLFSALLEATRVTTRVILVGDADQLPSVGAGNVLCDLIASNSVPFIKLNKIFRQSADSTIASLAHRIISGDAPENFDNSSDFFFLTREGSFSVCKTVEELCLTRLPEAYGFSPYTDIQVICPSRKKDCGTVNLNNILQNAINPLKKKDIELNYKGAAFRKGDKVMQIKNDYDLMWTADNGEVGSGVFNGDIGFIIEIDARNRILKVKFDDKTATYNDENLELLELAYAVTVHKSQGCEFECVILPLYDVSSLLQYRNLLYTAITRAKKILILVGDRSVFYNMVENDRRTLRYTALKYFLNGNIDE